MNPARYAGTAPTSRNRSTLRRRDHFGKSVLEQRRPGGVAGAHRRSRRRTRRRSGCSRPAQLRGRSASCSVGTVTMNPWVASSSPQVTTVPVTRRVSVADPSKAAMDTVVTDSDPEILCRCPAEDDLVRSFGIAPVRHWRPSSTEDRLERLGLDLGPACADRRHRVVVDHQLSGHRLDAGCGDRPFDGLRRRRTSRSPR